NPQYAFTPPVPNKAGIINVLEKGIDKFLVDIHGEISLDIINEISNLKYEKANIKGEIVFPTALVEHIVNNPNRVINLHSLVSFKETRKIRKLLEMTSEKYRLISLDESKSYGNHNFDAYGVSIGTIKESYLDACFIIKFNGPLEWELYRGNKFILSSSNYKVSLRMNSPDVKSYLKDKFHSVFDKNDSNFERVWEIIQASTQQSKGTMLVVSNKAKEESYRLKDMSFNVNPFRLTKNFVKTISSIDGAIMADPSGVCHALGVILDGISVEYSAADPSRGARYNSAIKYRDLMKMDSKARFMIVVVSEDGMIDVIH
ncbi:diadenylate cyclase, partial [Priestia megaterium]